MLGVTNFFIAGQRDRQSQITVVSHFVRKAYSRGIRLISDYLAKGGYLDYSRVVHLASVLFAGILLTPGAKVKCPN